MAPWKVAPWKVDRGRWKLVQVLWNVLAFTGTLIACCSVKCDAKVNKKRVLLGNLVVSDDIECFRFACTMS